MLFAEVRGPIRCQSPGIGRRPSPFHLIGNSRQAEKYNSALRPSMPLSILSDFGGVRINSLTSALILLMAVFTRSFDGRLSNVTMQFLSFWTIREMAIGRARDWASNCP